MAALSKVDYICDVPMGFRYSPPSTFSFGFVTHLGIADEEMAADLEVANPFGAPLPVAGVLERISWAGGVTDPIAFQFGVSAGTYPRLASLNEQAPRSNALSIGWVVYSYDDKLDAWFVAFESVKGYAPTGSGSTAGLTRVVSGDIAVRGLELFPAPSVVNGVTNYKVLLNAGPASTVEPQELLIADSPQAGRIYHWNA
jgi:hypothetical protein